MSRKATKPNIFEYLDYRKFLIDWLAYKKASQSNFSIRSLCEKTKISLGYLSMVKSGKRNITTKALNKINTELNLNNNELSHFRKIIDICDSEDSAIRNKSLQALKRSAHSKKYHIEDLDAHEYTSNWYYVAIRELSNHPSFKLDANWIQNHLRPKVSIKNIQKAMDYLASKNLFQDQPNSGQTLDCTEGVYKISLHQFHSQIFDLAKESIQSVLRNKREIKGLTIGLDQQGLDQLKEEVGQLFKKYSEMGSDMAKGEVYQIEFAAFPLSADLTKEENDESSK